MRVIEASCVDEALFRGLTLLTNEGLRQGSRNGEVLVMPCPVMTVNHSPLCRVSFSPKRDANPFFHLMEAIWMLAGRNDITWLDQFVGDFSKRFGDAVSIHEHPSGLLQHGAYGFRWRNHFDIDGGGGGWPPDQLDKAVAMLRANPDDRRVVIAMWDPVADLGANKRDIPCLAGETPIWSPEGDLTISELASRFAKGELQRWPVYSVNTEDWSAHIAWCTKVWKSGRKRLLKLTFDDGSSIRVTADHRLYKRAGLWGGSAVRKTSEVRADQLQVGDRVLALTRLVDGKGYQYLKRELGKNTAFSNRQKVHVAYWNFLHGPTPDGHVIHHDDDNKTNNKGNNLLCWTLSKHNSHHRLGDRNPMRRLSVEQHARRARKQGAALKANWARLSPEERKLRSKGLLDNHRLIAVEELGVEDVYDFEVPMYHNAVVGTGVLAHNCNTHIYLRTRRVENKPDHTPYNTLTVLDLTVCCRSNDAVWGCHGANAVHFSILQEYLAARIGVDVGKLYQLSNNYHVYTEVLSKVWPMGLDGIDRYERRHVAPLLLVSDAAEFDADLRIFFSTTWDVPSRYANRFFANVAVPMRRAYALWRARAFTPAQEFARSMPHSDWKSAAEDWFARRLTKHME